MRRERLIMESIIVAALALVGTLAGTYFSNRKGAALIAYRLEALEKRVDEHNDLIDRLYKVEQRTEMQEVKIEKLENRVEKLEALTGRTYELEERTELQEEKIKVANHRIDDLEGFHKGGGK